MFYVRGDQWWHVGALIGIAAGVAIAFASTRLAIVIGSVGFILLGIWRIFAMPEDHFVRREREGGVLRHPRALDDVPRRRA